MSMPTPGNYYIVNRGTTSDGTPLAITFNGENAPLTVIEKGSQAAQQVWTIKATVNGNTQDIVLQEAPNIVPNPSGGNIVGGPGGSSWAIRGTNGIYTIAMGSFTNYWGINEASVGQHVVYGDLTDDIKQNWELILA